MNIDDYRAMVAEEAQQEQEQQQTDSKGEQPDAQAQQDSVDDTETFVQAQEQVDYTSQDDSDEEGNAQGGEQTLPESIEVDGEEVSLDELRNGYLRQSDYTRKTQELARNKKKSDLAERYYEAVASDPEVQRQIANLHNLPYETPEQARVSELEQNYQDLLLQQEITTLESKYDDFDVQSVVKLAYDKKLPNLEDAYLLSKASTGGKQEAVDVESLTEQIRQQVMSELQSTKDTNSVIGTGGGSSAQVEPTTNLSQGELRVAKAMGLSPKEYAKWSK